MQVFWRRVGTGSAIAALALLGLEHLVNAAASHLDPVHHWLSEYVLSPSPAARYMMFAAFILLGCAAASVAALSQHLAPKALFAVSSASLVAMAFFNTDPNDGKDYPFRWPLSAGNVHQLLLYAAIGATIAGMALQTIWLADPARRRRLLELSLLAVTIAATAIQVGLVARSLPGKTYYGGVTERIVVVAMLGWVLSYCARASNPARPD